MDYYTEWSEVHPLTNQEETIVAKATVENWVSRFRDSLALQSNQRRHCNQMVWSIFLTINKTITKK